MWRFWTCFGMIVLTGCAKVELYSQLDEQQANEMMAILLADGVSCSKAPGEEGTWNLQVSQSDFSRSVNRLREKGFPKARYMGMGDIFKKSGLVSSPTEERIRFMHALSQELSQTISQIDGVLSARVHIVLPNNNPFGDTIQPSSASVFVKHQPGANLNVQIPEITRLVVGSIEGLEYDAVSTVLFAAEDVQPLAADSADVTQVAMVKFLGFDVTTQTSQRLNLVLVALLAVLGVSMAVAGFLLARRRSQATDRVKTPTNALANRTLTRPMTA